MEAIVAHSRRKILVLQQMPYAEYLLSEHWLSTRDWMLDFAGYRCQLCSDNVGLQVHHSNYVYIGCESRYDLAVLCIACHKRHHGSNMPADLSQIKGLAPASTGRKCHGCGSLLYEKVGAYGKFWACPEWPNCKAQNLLGA